MKKKQRRGRSKAIVTVLFMIMFVIGVVQLREEVVYAVLQEDPWWSSGDSYNLDGLFEWKENYNNTYVEIGENNLCENKVKFKTNKTVVAQISVVSGELPYFSLELGNENFKFTTDIYGKTDWESEGIEAASISAGKINDINIVNNNSYYIVVTRDNNILTVDYIDKTSNIIICEDLKVISENDIGEEITGRVICGNGVYYVTWRDFAYVEKNENVTQKYEYEAIDEHSIKITNYNSIDAEAVVPAEIDGKKVVELGDNVFYDTPFLYSVQLPDTIKKIGYGCFQNSGIRSIIIPDSVEQIEEYAFGECKNLESVTLSNNLLKIGRQAFSQSNIKEIFIPSKVEELSGNIFQYCDSLNSISVADDNKYFCSVDGVLFNKNMTKLISYPIARNMDTYIVPEGVVTIGESAFEESSVFESQLVSGRINLSKVYLPSSLKEIEYCAFSNCVGLTKLVLPEGVKKIGDYAFANCVKLIDDGLVFPRSVEEIGNYVMWIGNYVDTPVFVVYPDSYAEKYALEREEYKDILCYANEQSFDNGVYVSCYGKDFTGKETLYADILNKGDEQYPECDGDILENNNKFKVYSIYMKDEEGKLYIPEGRWHVEIPIDEEATEKYVYYISNDNKLKNINKSNTCAYIEDGKLIIDIDYIGRLIVSDIQLIESEFLVNTYCVYDEWVVYKDEVYIVEEVYEDGGSRGHMEEGWCIDEYLGEEVDIVIPTNIANRNVISLGENLLRKIGVVDSIYIPSTIREIAYDRYSGMIREMIISDENPVYKSVEGVVYSKDGKTLIMCSAGIIGDCKILEGVEYIAHNAFESCEFASIDIPEGVLSIGSAAFKNCKGLLTVSLPISLRGISSNCFENTNCGVKYINYEGDRDAWEKLIGEQWIDEITYTVINFKDSFENENYIEVISSGNDYTWCLKNGRIIYNYTGIIRDYEGNDWYIENGRVRKDYTGLLKNENGWWYVNAGKIDLTYTGMAKNEYGWWYVKNGQLDRTYTGLAKSENGWWYVKNGQLDRTYTGMAKNENGWFYVRNGQLDRTYTGLAKNQYGTWYMVDGKVASNKSGLTKVSKVWLYLSKGKVDTSYTGLAKNEYGWWYVKNGQLDRTYTGMAKNEKGWFYVKSGKVDLEYTGLAENEYGTWYMVDGKVASNKSGLTKVSKIWLYLSKGKVDTSYTGLAKNEYGWWYVKNGQLDRTYTGLAKNEYGWWHVKNGQLDRTYTGISANQYGKWYVKNGKVDLTYIGTLEINGVTYSIKEGKVLQ